MKKRFLLLVMLTILLLTLATLLMACDPHAHNYTSQTEQATCTEKGLTTYTCSCGDSYT